MAFPSRPCANGPPRSLPVPVLALKAQTPHQASIVARDRGTGPPQVLSAQGTLGCSRSLGPSRPHWTGLPRWQGASMSCTWPLASPPRYALRRSQWPASAAAMKVEEMAKQRLHPETAEASSEVQGRGGRLGRAGVLERPVPGTPAGNNRELGRSRASPLRARLGPGTLPLASVPLPLGRRDRPVPALLRAVLSRRAGLRWPWKRDRVEPDSVTDGESRGRVCARIVGGCACLLVWQRAARHLSEVASPFRTAWRLG